MQGAPEMVPCLCGQTTCLSCKKTVGLNTEWTYGTSQHQKEHLCSTLNSSWQQASKYQQTHSEAFFSLRLLSFQVLPVLCIFRILRLIIHPPVWLPSLAFFLIFFLFCLIRFGHQGLDFLLILVFRLLLLLLLVFMLCPLQLVLMLLRQPMSDFAESRWLQASCSKATLFSISLHSSAYSSSWPCNFCRSSRMCWSNLSCSATF